MKDPVKMNYRLEKISASHICDKGLVFRIYKNSQITHKKMFSIICHQENVNLNHHKISPHACQTSG